ncbi:MAG: hypothetical protein IKJ67_01035 [Bacteroidales bacterium]|nr:hypothetical protein [Bacteroidales bacterium]
MKEKEANLIYALDKNGNLVHVDNVNNGLKCECVCPKCKSKLNAKNEGTKKIHHFAHKADSDCQGAVETAIHMLAKEILQEIKSVLLPSTPNFPNGRILDFDNVEIEIFDRKLKLRPDCIGYYEDKKLWIEFKYTHEVDPKKRKEIILAHIDCIEIDISNCTQDKDNIKECILNDLEKREWIYNEDNIREEKNKSQNHKSHTHDNKRDNSLANEDNIREEKNTFPDYKDFYTRDNKWDNSLKRIFAIDENGIIVNSNDIKNNDEKPFKYYCVVCKQEVSLSYNNLDGYFFKHMENNSSCTDECYLIKASEYLIKYKFDTQKKFLISFEQRHICSKNEICDNYNDKICYTYKSVDYDLKDLNYDLCEIIDSNSHCQNSYLTISSSQRKNQNINSEIYIVINSKNNSFPSNKRVLDIDIKNQKYLPYLMLKESSINGRAYNFKNKKQSYSCPEEVKINYFQFKSSSNGTINIEIKTSSCTNIKSNHDTINLYIIENQDLYDKYDYDSLIKYFLLYCHKTNKSVRFCEICFFLKDNNFSSICTRYKTKSTPKYPLKEKTAPLECPYFRLNTQLKNHIEYKYKNFKIIEYPFFEQTTK